MHIASDECFFAVGCWHPDAHALGRIRDLLARKPENWLAARDHKKFVARWELAGDRLTRPPRGYAADHPAIEDLKRKDFIGVAPLSRAEVAGSGLVKLAGARFAEAVPFMTFLCAALNVPY